MRFSTRRILIAAITTKLIVTGFFWQRSYNVDDSWPVHTYDHGLKFASWHGRLFLYIYNLPRKEKCVFYLNIPMVGLQYEAPDRAGAALWNDWQQKINGLTARDYISWGSIIFSEESISNGFGFGIKALTFPDHTASATVISIPFWFISLILLLWILMLAAAQPLRTYLRRYRGRCGSCNYDLRAHRPGDRCPECGTEVPTPAGGKIAPLV